MKRYSPYDNRPDSDIEMGEFEEGDFVKYEDVEKLINALKFYAKSEHIEDLQNDLENPSGEPVNWVCDSDGKFNLENGGVARQALKEVGYE